MVIGENEQILYTDDAWYYATIIVTGEEFPYSNTKHIEADDYGCYRFTFRAYAKKKRDAIFDHKYKQTFRFRGDYARNVSAIGGNYENDTIFSVAGTIPLTDMDVGEIILFDTKEFFVRDVRDFIAWIGGGQKPITGDFDVYFEIGSDRIKSNSVRIAYKAQKPYTAISVSNTKQHQCDVCVYVSYNDEKLKHPYDEINYEIFLNTSDTPIFQGKTSQSRGDPLKIEQTIALPKSNENYTVSVAAYFNYWNSKEPLQSCAFHSLPIYIGSFGLSDVVVNENESVSIAPNAVLPSNHDISLYTMQSDDAELATVSRNTLYGKQKGSGTYTAYAQDGGGASTTARFTVKRYAKDIELNRYELRLAPGQTFQISTTVFPSGSTDCETGTAAYFTYTSSNPSVCEISDSGLICAYPQEQDVKAVSPDGEDTETEPDVGASLSSEANITVTLHSERPNTTISKTIHVIVTDALVWTTLSVPDYVSWIWVDEYTDNLKILRNYINTYISNKGLSIERLDELLQVDTYLHEATPIAHMVTILNQLEENITAIHEKMSQIGAQSVVDKYHRSVSWSSGTKNVRAFVCRWVNFADDCYEWLLFN